MMRSVIIGRGVFLSLAIVVAACAAGDPAETAAREAVSAQLKDPFSAQFRNLRRHSPHTAGWCGEVNAKNSFGGYVGWRLFSAIPQGDGSWSVWIVNGHDEPFDAARADAVTRIACGLKADGSGPLP